MERKFIKEIKSKESPPKLIKKFFDENEIKELIDLYNKLPVTVHNKKQNVIKKRWTENFNNEIEKKFLDKLKDAIGEFEIDNLKSEDGKQSLGLFQESFGPIGLHVDTGFNLNDKFYKQTLVPFDNSGQTIIFKNRFYGLSTNFINDKKELEEFKDQFGKNKRSNEHLYIYGNKPFDKTSYEKYLKHIDYNNLKGLEIESVYEWKIGDIFIFDRSHLHSSSCNINKKKLGFATFTKRK